MYRLGSVKVQKKSHTLNHPPTRICLVQEKTNAKNYFPEAESWIMHGLSCMPINYGKIPLFLNF